ncbi:phosphonate C-P lyase system protein PhnG [Rhodocyclaceae bacterium SMB388]
MTRFDEMTAAPAARGQWLRLWSALPAAAIQQVARPLAQHYAAEDLALAESGLGLLPVNDSALGDTYFVGEVPLARAHVRLRAEDGATAEGAAVLIDDRARLARALAVLDAVCAARWPGCEAADALLEQGRSALTEQDRMRKAILAATRVDFALLGAVEDDEDE